MKDADILSYISRSAFRMGIPVPKVELNRRFTYTLGEACTVKGEGIRPNARWMHRTSDTNAKAVILHELCHLKDHMAGNCGHGATFRALCKQYGCPATSAFTRKEKKKLKEAGVL